MEEKVQIFTYSVADLKEWLLHNNSVNGLSAEVIAPARAYAILNNPFVTDDMRVVCALFVNGRLAAYTAAFPEVLNKPVDRLAWWFSTLWCDKGYVGRGFGLAVVGTLCELIGPGNFFDAEGARETVEIFRLLGLDNAFVPRYVFSGKDIQKNSFGGKLAWCHERFSQWVCSYKRKALMHRSECDMDYTLYYSQFVDDEAYSFIECHSDEDVMLRKQKTFNWILQYPFVQISPLHCRVSSDNHFSSTIKEYQSFCCKIFVEDRLVGVTIMVAKGESLSVKYLYYEREKEGVVFRVIVDHMLSMRIKRFETNDIRLYEYILPLGIFSKHYISSSSFSYPRDFTFLNSLKLQAGEGDMFV